jgi:hypothetical protein
MAQNAKTAVARLNIYLPDPDMRRQVKAAAARQDLSVSEYCVQAITRRLAEGGDITPHRGGPAPMRAAVAAARRFQRQAFRGRVFAVSSAELIAEARNGRPRR